MNASVSITSSPTAMTETQTPLILRSLPNPPVVEDICPRRARQQLDLLLLAIEALDLTGSEAILAVAQELELTSVIKHRVYLWQLRNSNPLRRYTQRQPLTLTEAKAMVAIICYLARRLTVIIRQLLLAYDQLQAKQLSPEHHFRLAMYLERFRAHFRSRMNPKRTAVVAYTVDEQKLNDLAIRLLGQLLFCTGIFGMQRLWASLFDGEVR